jgi:arylsulfatase A-like enzyme
MKVIVVLLRGLHLGYLGCYGNEWIDTPHLDRLAAEGVVFDQHFAECPDAAAARRAWRSGLLTPPADEPPDLISLLQESGVSCQLIVDAAHDDASDFRRGWSSVRQAAVDYDSDEPLSGLAEHVRDGLNDLSTYENGLLWIDSAILIPPWSIPQEHLDAHFNPAPIDEGEEEADTVGEEEPMEPLLNQVPGSLPAPADESYQRLQLTYAAAISYVDGFVGLLCDALRDRNLADETLLIVTTDHGQALGEHGIVGPFRPWLHDELIHIPLLMRLPRGVAAGRRIAALTQSVDLHATLLDAFGIQPQSTHGYSLLPLARAESEQLRSFACSSLKLGEREEWALRTHEWALILPVAQAIDDPVRGPQLYVKPDDRWEVNNVLQHHLDLGERLEAVLREYMAAPRRVGLETPWRNNEGQA